MSESVLTVPVLMEIDPDKHEMWIRVGAVDSEYCRQYLRPGCAVTLHGHVARYELSGGYDDFEGDFILAADRFQLSVGSLELATEVKVSPTGDTP